MIETNDYQYDPYFDGVRTKLLHHLQIDGIKRILDVGTGNGFFAIEAAEYFREAQVVGIDTIPQYLNRAKKLAESSGASERICFRCGSFLDDKLVGELPYDLLTAFMFFTEIEESDLSDYFAQMGDCLVTNGYLLVIDRFLPYFGDTPEQDGVWLNGQLGYQHHELKPFVERARENHFQLIANDRVQFPRIALSNDELRQYVKEECFYNILAGKKHDYEESIRLMTEREFFTKNKKVVVEPTPEFFLFRKR